MYFAVVACTRTNKSKKEISVPILATVEKAETGATAAETATQSKADSFDWVAEKIGVYPD